MNIKDYLHLYRNDDTEFYTKNILAVAHNMIGVLENRDWERLPDKLWSLKDAYQKLDAIVNAKLALRPLTDLKEDELDGVINYQFFKDHSDIYTNVAYCVIPSAIVVNYLLHGEQRQNIYWFDKIYSPENVRFLLSKGFDLFGLIEAGLAIDKTLTPKPHV